MSRGPKLEQIENHDYSTCRVEIEWDELGRKIVDGCELLPSHEAMRIARELWQQTKDHGAIAVHVVNERTGFTSDTISRG